MNEDLKRMLDSTKDEKERDLIIERYIESLISKCGMNSSAKQNNEVKKRVTI